MYQPCQKSKSRASHLRVPARRILPGRAGLRLSTDMIQAAMSTERPETIAKLRTAGYVFLPAPAALATLQLDVPGLEALRGSWQRLPRDGYLRDGGRYRARRHSCFVQTLTPPALEAVPHRAHWQPTSYNALHGGLTRWFEPVEPEVSGARAWQQLVTAIGEVFAGV